MKIAGFEFAEGARFQTGATRDPNIVGEHLELLRKRFKGELTPHDVLKDARNPNSPLHGFFEWDDGEAAEQYRLQQARGLIRAVVAVYQRDDKPPTPMRAYVHIPDVKTPHYREISHALSIAATRGVVLKQALAELNAWRKRYQDLDEFSQLIEAIDETQNAIQKAS